MPIAQPKFVAIECLCLTIQAFITLFGECTPLPFARVGLQHVDLQRYWNFLFYLRWVSNSMCWYWPVSTTCGPTASLQFLCFFPSRHSPDQGRKRDEFKDTRKQKSGTRAPQSCQVLQSAIYPSHQCERMTPSTPHVCASPRSLPV